MAFVRVCLFAFFDMSAFGLIIFLQLLFSSASVQVSFAFV